MALDRADAVIEGGQIARLDEGPHEARLVVRGQEALEVRRAQGELVPVRALQARASPAIRLGGEVRPAHMHKECLLRDVLGPLAHIDGRCHHYGGDGNGTPGMTVRQEALEIWRRTQEGTLYGR